MSEPIPSDLHISVCLKVDNDNGSMTCMPVVLAMKQHPEETHKALIAAIRDISSSPEAPKAFSLDLLDELLVHLDKDHHIPHHVLNKARYTMETYRDNARIVRQAAAANKKRKANNSATDFKFVNMGVRSSIPKPPPKPQTGQQKPWQASKYQEHVPSPTDSTYRSVYSETQPSASPGPEQSHHLRHDQFARRDSYRSLYPETQQSHSPGSSGEQHSQGRPDPRPLGESYRRSYSEAQPSGSPGLTPEQSEHFRHDQFARRDSYISVYSEARQSVSPLSAAGQNNHVRPDQPAQTPQYPSRPDQPAQTPQYPSRPDQPAQTPQYPSQPSEPYRTVYPKPQPPPLPSSGIEQTSNSRPEQLPQAPRYQEQVASLDLKPIRPIILSSSSPVSAPDQSNHSQPDQTPQTARYPFNPFKTHQESQQSAPPASGPEQKDRTLPEQLARAALSMSRDLNGTPGASQTAHNSQGSEQPSHDARQSKTASDYLPPPPPPISPLRAYELKLHELDLLRAQLRDGDALLRSQPRPFDQTGYHSEAKQHERQERVVQCLNELNNLREKLPPDSVPEPPAPITTLPHTPTERTFKFPPTYAGPPPPPQASSSPQSPPHNQTLPNVNSILNGTASEIKTLPPYLSIYGPPAPKQGPSSPPAEKMDHPPKKESPGS